MDKCLLIIIILVQVDTPFLSLDEDSVYVYINSTSMELNITEIEPDLIEFLQDEDKVSVLENDKLFVCLFFFFFESVKNQ